MSLLGGRTSLVYLPTFGYDGPAIAPADLIRRARYPVERRTFIAIVASGPLAAPLGSEGQQAAKLPTIGLLAASTPSTDSHRIAAFSQRLHELGWTEGRNVAIEYRWAQGRSERSASALARESDSLGFRSPE